MVEIAFAVTWFLSVSLVGLCFGMAYDYLVVRKSNGLIPVSLLVVGGVTITEIIRAVRALPLAALAAKRVGLDPLTACALLVAFCAADSITAYAATGLPNIYGNWKRERWKQNSYRRANEARIDEGRARIRALEEDDANA